MICLMALAAFAKREPLQDQTRAGHTNAWRQGPISRQETSQVLCTQWERSDSFVFEGLPDGGFRFCFSCLIVTPHVTSMSNKKLRVV